MLKISIAKPCHENWDGMSPNKQGRHCSACAKTVVDFTTMTDEAVQHYFINKKKENTCGRFRDEQLQRICIELPENIFYLKIAGWKKFLAACLLIFSTTLFSCDTKVKKGEVTGLIIPEIQQPLKSRQLTVGGFNTQWDSTLAFQTITCTTATLGFTSYVEVDTPMIKLDTIPASLLMGDTVMQVLPDSVHLQDSLPIKNPPKADAVQCDSSAINYL